MGLSFRGKTKGKKSWLNYSFSRKRGFNSSISFKLGKNLTINLGKHGTRTTMNFGNGFVYRGYNKNKKKKPKTQKQPTRTYYEYNRPEAPPTPLTPAQVTYLKQKEKAYRESIFKSDQEQKEFNKYFTIFIVCPIFFIIFWLTCSFLFGVIMTGLIYFVTSKILEI